MNIQPNAPAISAAGTSHAASKGGETDKQSAESARRQSVRETPAGQRPDANAVEAGEPLGDRDADGRQLYDTFERAGEHEGSDSENDETQENENENDETQNPQDPQQSSDPGTSAGRGAHLDLEA